jgi:hypothetical protein
MIVPWIIFVVVGLLTYAGFVKIAARLLRYKVSWKSSFLFAVIVLVLVIFDHALAFHQPVTIRIVHAVVLLLVLVILGSWFFSGRGMNRGGTVLGWGGGIRLIALVFAMMAVVAFAIVLPAQVFLTKQLSPPH